MRDDDNTLRLACEIALEENSGYPIEVKILAKHWLSEHPVPCEYCSGDENKVILETKSEHEDTVNYNIYISANAPRLVAMGDNWIDSFSTEIHYCPMCGRKLEGV